MMPEHLDFPYVILIKQWSATDYAYLVNNELGVVLEKPDRWAFETPEAMKKFQDYLDGTS